jgi:peptidoglycan/LPS O-acetylase OafA/YrhL
MSQPSPNVARPVAGELSSNHSSTSTKSVYRPDIDGLRSVAVLLVLVFHFGLFGFGKAGFIGVDVFFVISGFLISSLIWQQLEAGSFSLRRFYLRRFRRLAPAFVCVQLILLAAAYALMLPTEVRDLIKQTVSAQTYLINFYLWKSVNYFGLQAESVPLLHCWSLAVEEQFYLTYPLLLIGVHRFARGYFPLILILVTLASFGLNVAFVSSHQGAVFYLLPSRAWELSIGAMVPLAQRWFASRRWLREAAAVIGAVLIALGVTLYSRQIPFPGFFALYPTIGAACLILAGASDGSWISTVLSQKPLVYVGRISYSLYLVHWPVRVLLETVARDYTVFWRWLSFALSLLLASLLFHVVEDPVRRGTVLPTGRKFVAGYAAGFGVVMLIAGSAHLTLGWTHRFDSVAVRLAEYENDRNDAAQRCEYSGQSWDPNMALCRLGDPQASPTWLVFGDSHAWALGDSFSNLLKHRHQAGRLVFAHGCMPIAGLGGSDCQRFTAALLQHIAQTPEIKTVALVSIWRQVFEGESLQGPGGDLVTGPARVDVFQDQFHLTLQRLHDSGKSVVIWEPLPSTRRSVPKQLAWNRITGKEVGIATTRREHERTFRFMTDAIRNNSQLIDATISPASVLCPTDTCLVENEGVPLYFDNNHPSRSAAQYYAILIESQLRPEL